MNSWRKILAVGVALTVVACGGGGGASAGGGGGDGDPLEGTWVEDTSDQGESFRYTFVLGGNGKASVEEIAVNPPDGEVCSGTLHFTGLKWSHTTTSLTISGSGCSGRINCHSSSFAVEYACDKPAREQRFVCTYSLSADEDTLNVSDFTVDKSSFDPATFERMK